MRAIVTCECCRHRQWLVRPIDRPEAFHVICNQCERVLQVAVTDDHLAAAASSVPGEDPPPAPFAFPDETGLWPRPLGGAGAGGWTSPLV